MQFPEMFDNEPDLRLGESWVVMHYRCAFVNDTEHVGDGELEFELVDGGSRGTHDLAAQAYGWREVEPDGWLCPDCLKNL